MKKYQVPDPAEYDQPGFDNAAHDAIVEWLHTMTQEWDGDPAGITIYPPLGPNGEVSEAELAGPGDWVVEENGVFRVVKTSDYDEFMKRYRFEHTIERFATLNAFLNVKMFFEEGDLVKAEIRYDDEVIIMSSSMLFAVMGADAHQLYEIAASAEQDERLTK